MTQGQAIEINGEMTVDNVIKVLSDSLMEHGVFDLIDPDNLVEVAEDIVAHRKHFVSVGFDHSNIDVDEIFDSERAEELIFEPLTLENIELLDAKMIIAALEKVKTKEIKKVLEEASPLPIPKMIVQAFRAHLIEKINNEIIKHESNVLKEVLGEDVKLTLEAM